MRSEEETRALAVADRALRNYTGPDPVDYQSVEPATWPDASMGWPEPGKSYAQVLTEGYKITALSAGKLYECRVSGENVRCRVIRGG